MYRHAETIPGVGQNNREVIRAARIVPWDT